jgi:hypothetical protein
MEERPSGQVSPERRHRDTGNPLAIYRPEQLETPWMDVKDFLE